MISTKSILTVRRRLVGALIFMAFQHVHALDKWPDLQQSPVQLVANDWCPQHCESGQPDKGYVIDIVTQALDSQGVPFTLRFYPWTRAMMMVDRGEADGLLTPTVTGFPQFVYHTQAVGYQQYCFYADQSRTWRYRKPEDLQNQRIAMLADSGLGPIDDYLNANRKTITVTSLTGDHEFAKRLFLFLGLNRADAVVITSDVFSYGQLKGDIGKNFKSVGCLEQEKMAVGLSKKNAKRSATIAQALDAGIMKLRSSGQLAKTLARYGIKDWHK